MPDSNTVLIVNPEFDVATSFTHFWTNEIVNEAQQIGLNVVVLDKDEARLPQFENAIANSDPLLVYAQGHGSERILTAMDQEHILWIPSAEWGHDDTNINLVQGRFNYMLSCLTGQALGPAIGAQPDTYYIGYKEDFIFTGFTPGDQYSSPFGECSNAIARTLLRGGTIEEAYNEGIRMFDLLIAQWQQSSDPSAPFIVSALLHDRDALIIFPGMPTPPPSGPEIPVESPFLKIVTSGYGALISLAFI